MWSIRMTWPKAPGETLPSGEPDDGSMPRNPNLMQAVGMFDAANGSVLQQVKIYAAGRYDPQSPMGDREYLLAMDRYCGFVYHQLIADLLNSPALRR